MIRCSCKAWGNQTHVRPQPRLVENEALAQLGMRLTGIFRRSVKHTSVQGPGRFRKVRRGMQSRDATQLSDRKSPRLLGSMSAIPVGPRPGMPGHMGLKTEGKPPFWRGGGCPYSRDTRKHQVPVIYVPRRVPPAHSLLLRDALRGARGGHHPNPQPGRWRLCGRV